jgi:hypothetical protein
MGDVITNRKKKKGKKSNQKKIIRENIFPYLKV